MLFLGLRISHPLSCRHCDAIILLKLPRIINLVMLVNMMVQHQDQMVLDFIENIYISCTIFPRRSVGHFNGKISKYKNKALKPKLNYFKELCFPLQFQLNYCRNKGEAFVLPLNSGGFVVCSDTSEN